MNVRLAIPLLLQEGWLRHQEKDAKPPQRRRRGGWKLTKCFRMHSLKEVPFSTTPSAPLKEASRLLLDVASTPPVSGACPSNSESRNRSGHKFEIRIRSDGRQPRIGGANRRFKGLIPLLPRVSVDCERCITNSTHRRHCFLHVAETAEILGIV